MMRGESECDFGALGDRCQGHTTLLISLCISFPHVSEVLGAQEAWRVSLGHKEKQKLQSWLFLNSAST